MSDTGTLRRLGEEVAVYSRHCLAMLLPGRTRPYVKVHKEEPGSVREWPDPDLMLLVDECRRQLDRQRGELARLQGLSQFLFSTGLAMIALAGVALPAVKASHNMVAAVLWIAAALLLGCGTWGAAANLSTKNLLGVVDGVLLSRCEPPTLPLVAEAHSQQIAVGANTVATRLMIYRDAAFLVLLSAVMFMTAWWLAT